MNTALLLIRDVNGLLFCRAAPNLSPWSTHCRYIAVVAPLTGLQYRESFFSWSRPFESATARRLFASVLPLLSTCRLGSPLLEPARTLEYETAVWGCAQPCVPAEVKILMRRRSMILVQGFFRRAGWPLRQNRTSL